MITRRINYLAILLLSVIATGAAWAQTADSLGYYLETAALNNPGVKADFMAYKASLQKVPQAGAYQDPEFEMGVFLKPMDILGGKQVAEFKLMQMFPWFGTRKAAQTEAVHMAKMSFEQFRETRDNLYLEVYTQWFMLCNLRQKLRNNEDNKALLVQLEQLALRRFSSPSTGSGAGYAVAAPTPPTSTPPAGSGMSSMSSMGGSNGSQSSTQGAGMSMGNSGGGMSGGMSEAASGGMSDVLRIQLEIAELDNNIESLLSEMNAEKARFNALLNRPADSEVRVPETFGQIPFLFDPETAMTDIDEQNPMLGMIDEEGLAYKAKAEMDRKMSYPMFGIGVQYMLNKKTDDPMLGMGDMNGRDMVMPMLSVSIPLYRNKYKAQQRESQFRWQANKEKYSNTYNALESELLKTKHLLDDAARKIVLYKKQSALARTTYNLVVQEFVAGKSDLTNVIQVQRQLLDYRLKEAEAVADYNTRVASIQKLISFKDTEQNVNRTYYGNE